MKKKISVLVSALAALSIFATACDSKHTHTFSEDWESDATNHWHAATCEHGEEKSALAKHKDEDEDGKCDVCAYKVGHTHTYAEDWSKDDTHHWHASTCTHTDEVADKGLHEDVAADGTCDVCGGHAHVVNKAGVCDVCDEQVKPMDETNLEMVIAATALRYKNIKESTIVEEFSSTIKSVFDDSVSDGESPYGYKNRQTTTMYTLGENATMIVSSTENQTKDKNRDGEIYTTENESNSKKWMYYDANDTETPYKGFEETIDNVGTADQKTNVAPISVGEDDLFGYYYAVSTLADAYSAENILTALYERSQNTTASGYTVNYDAENNHYTFTFSNLIIHETDTNEGPVTNVNLFETLVSFVYSDTYELTNLYIKTDCYTNDAGEGSEADITLEEVDGEWVKKDGATPNTYEITTVQTVGERTYTHTKSINEYLPTTFTFKNGSETVTNNATLSYERGEDLELDIVCDGYFDFIRKQVSATLTSASGNPATSIEFRDAGTPFVASYGLAEGTYTLTVKNGNDTLLTATVEVEAPQVQGASISVEITDTYTFADVASLEASESGTYTFTLPEGYGAWDKDDCDSYRGSPYVDPQDLYSYDPSNTSFSVDIAAGDTYEFYVLSIVGKGIVQIPYTFEAKDIQGGGGNVGGGDDITYDTVLVNGSNTVYFSSIEISNGSAVRLFTVTTAGDYSFKSNDLSVTAVTLSGGTEVTKNSDYSYSLTAGTYSVTFGWFSIFGTQADTAYTLTIEAKQASNPVDITGTYYGTSDDGSSYPLTVTIDATTVTFNYAPPYGNPQTYVCDYTIDGNTVTLTKDGTAVNALQAKLTVENGVLTVAGYNGWDYDLTTTQPGGGGDTNPVDITGTYYGTDNWGNQSLTVTIDATTVTFAFANPMGTQTYVCDYAIDGDTVTLTKDGEAVPGLQATLTVEDGVLTAASYNGTDYTLSTSQSGGDVGGGDTSNTPTLSIGPNNIEVSEDDITNQVIVYSFVVEEEGTYSFASNNLGAQIVTAMGTQFGSAYLSEGTYTINVVTAYLSEGDAGTYTLTIEYTAPDTGDSGDTGETEGSMDNPITWTELPSSIETTENYVYYTYTATADGILSVSWATAVGYAEMYDATYDAYVYSSEATESFLAITKGTAYTIVLACIEGTGTATATISFQEIDVLTHNIYEDEAPVNTITVTADDIEKGALQYALIVKDAGKYTLVCEDFAIMQIKDNLGVKGVNSADLEAGLYTVIIVLENVEAGEYELTIGYTSPAGSMDNPIVWAELPSSVEVSSDSYIYYTYTPATAGTITFTWSVEGSADGSIVDESSIGVYTEYNSSTLTHNLTAGETYTISLSAWEDSTVTITFTPVA